jgi:hypothetical protein
MATFKHKLIAALQDPEVIHALAEVMEEHLVTDMTTRDQAGCGGVLLHRHHLEEAP